MLSLCNIWCYITNNHIFVCIYIVYYILTTFSGRRQREKRKRRKAVAARFEGIFSDKRGGAKLEERVYKDSGNEINAIYLFKANDLALALERNKELLQKVLNGKITLKQLARMSDDELM